MENIARRRAGVVYFEVKKAVKSIRFPRAIFCMLSSLLFLSFTMPVRAKAPVTTVLPTTYTLTYAAGANGTIDGATSRTQTVDYGTSGTAVTAVPNAGYQFVKWSDDLTSNPRTDANVTANISVTAIFAIVAPVNLGSTANFAVLAGYAITNVPTSAIIGDVGVSPAAESFITGFSQTDWTGYATSPQVTGKIYGADMADPTPAMLTTTKGDLTIAYNDAAGRTPMPAGPFLNPGSGDLAGLNLAPGLYKFTGAAIATTSFTLTGGENDVWIFQIASALTVSNGVHVTLAGGAQASNIFWQVGTAAIFGTTSVFQGTVMANASITLKTGATLNGRALAFSGTVALDSNIITVPGAASTAAKDWQLYY
jgi:hypothetical protein